MTSEQGPQRIRPAAVVRVGLRRSGNGNAMSQKAAEVQQSPMFSAISLADRKKIVSSAAKNPSSQRHSFPGRRSLPRISLTIDEHVASGICLERRKIVAGVFSGAAYPGKMRKEASQP